MILGEGPPDPRFMAPNKRRYRIVPALMGAFLLGTIVVGGIAANTGAIAASSNCGAYQQCPASSSPFPWWIVAVVVLIVAGALIAALVVMRRRRPPPGSGAEPMQPWEDQAPAAAPGTPPPPGAATPASYVETPEDVGQAPPGTPSGGIPPVGAATGAAMGGAAAAGAEGEPDIDSLMAELDKISGEILKRTPKKPGDGDSSSGGDEEPPTA